MNGHLWNAEGVALSIIQTTKSCYEIYPFLNWNLGVQQSPRESLLTCLCDSLTESKSHSADLIDFAD